MGATTFFKGILWILSAMLSFFIAAMTVSPQEAAANITRWLMLFGLRSASDWFSMHANRRVHVWPGSMIHAITTRCVGPSCAHAPSGSSFDVPDIVLIALTALVTALVLIWLMRRRPRSLLAPG